MKIRLLLAALCMLTLPMWFSSNNGVNSDPVPYATVAIAGQLLVAAGANAAAILPAAFATRVKGRPAKALNPRPMQHRCNSILKSDRVPYRTSTSVPVRSSSLSHCSFGAECERRLQATYRSKQ